MKGNTFAISFLLRRDKGNSNEYPIYARVTVNNQRVHIAVKRSIDPIFWDEGKFEAKRSMPNYREFNAYLQAFKGRLYACYTELIQRNQIVSASRIKDLFVGETTAEPLMLVKISEKHLSELMGFVGKSSSKGNYTNYKSTHKYIREFVLWNYKKADIPIEELNYSFLKKFELYVQTEKNCTQNGMMKHMQRLKKVLNWAIRNEYLDSNPFKNYSISFKKYDRGYLTMEEIEKIQGLKGLGRKLQYTKDFFVFQLYTGLAYADMMDLKTSDIKEGVDGESWIIKSRVKTDTRFTVPILPVAMKILKKYSPEMAGEQWVFPRISNQKMNKNLKELGEVAGIQKVLSTHLARHTAATTIWLSNGISLEVVSKMLGHTKIATTQVYGRVVEKKIAEEMDKLRDKLKGG